MIAATTPPRAHASQLPTPGAISLTKDLIATANHQHSLLSNFHKTTTYSNPSPVPCNPDNNVCKVITYRGEKVAAFNVEGRELICLPQAFELFLKHLVGGLHTVYTKLKRLDITPIVCNVEQVRILRGLGSIQPGVNRCKLISCKEFDILYEDCTNSSARPGRPPKRSPSIHASPETLEKLKKCRVDGDYPFDPRLYDRKSFLNGFAYHPYAIGQFPFMPLNHMNMISNPNSMALTSHFPRHESYKIGEGHTSTPEDVSQRIQGEATDNFTDRLFNAGFKMDHGRLKQNNHDDNKPLNLHINGDTKGSSKKEDSQRSDGDDDDEDDDASSDEQAEDVNTSQTTKYNDYMDTVTKETNGVSSFQPPNGEFPSISSVETLLLNIQRLVEVATENTRRHEQQLTIEKAALKMELLKTKESNEGLEKELKNEKRHAEILIKKLKREKRERKRLQEKLMTRTEDANKGDDVETKETSSNYDSDSDESLQLKHKPSLSPDEEKRIDSSMENRNFSFEDFMLQGKHKLTGECIPNSKDFSFSHLMTGKV